jgi:7-cyano-7-deazaguanine synthase
VPVEHTHTLHADRIAVLCSGGLDSIVLTADLATNAEVHPIYVASGLAWEADEQAVLRDGLAALPAPIPLAPLHVLEASVRDVYSPSHWAIVGTPPAYDTPDEDVYLVGRNIVLLGKASVYCALNRIGRIAMGPLAGNPFPDASPEFLVAMQQALSLGLGHALQIDTPYRTWDKEAVIRRGHALGVPMDLTLSCMNPVGRHHCGACSKCRERHDAFIAAIGHDPTQYARPLNGEDGLTVR